MKRLWGKRFGKQPGKELIAFTSGRDIKGMRGREYDLLPYNIIGNKAHCRMICKQGIVSKKEEAALLKGLDEISQLADQGRFILNTELEDAYSNVEQYLNKLCGPEIAGKLHSGRSRNDMVVLDTRLYLRDKTHKFITANLLFANTALKLAGSHLNTVMPGFTHHQHAMPTTFAHMLVSYAAAVERIITKFEQWLMLYNKCPLGSAAGFGTAIPIDRVCVAKLLGFDGVQENSLDVVSTRWEAEASMAYILAEMMNHFSRMAQDMILFSTPEFGFVTLSDAHSTGSSMMPQKRNPDVLEAVKAKAAMSQGYLLSILSIGKGNISGYNRDSQWTKYAIMDCIDECSAVPEMMAQVLAGLTVHKAAMLDACSKGGITATTSMESLVRKGMPMRKAKETVEASLKAGKLIALSPTAAVQAQDSLGGASPKAVKASITALTEAIRKHSS